MKRTDYKMLPTLKKVIHSWLKGQTLIWIKQFIKSSLVGGFAFFIYIILTAFFTEIFKFPYILSSSISFFISLLVNYIFSIGWVFRNERITLQAFLSKDSLNFIVIGIISFFINYLLISLLTDTLGVHYIVSSIIGAGVIFVWNFFARKIIIFKYDDK